MFAKKYTVLLVSFMIFGSVTPAFCTENATAEKKSKSPVVNTQSGDSLFVELNKLFTRQSNEVGALFDRYFSDKFFTIHNNPFADLDAWQKKAMQNVNTSFKQGFSNNWDSWYMGRFGTDGIKVLTQKADGKIILDISVPNVNADAISVDINNKRIKLEYNMKRLLKRRMRKEKSFSELKPTNT